MCVFMRLSKIPLLNSVGLALFGDLTFGSLFLLYSGIVPSLFRAVYDAYWGTNSSNSEIGSSSAIDTWLNLFEDATS